MRKRPLSPTLPEDGKDGSNGASRTETLVAIIDHWLAAKGLADQLGIRFLAYLLAMTVQEARANLHAGDKLAFHSMTNGASSS